MSAGLIIIVVVLAVLFLLAMVYPVKGGNMKKTSLEAYALFVCLVCLGVGAISLATATYDIVQISNPELTLDSYTHRKHQTNDAYWEGTSSFSSEGRREEKKRPQEDELTKKRVESFQLALSEEQRDGKKSLVSAIIAIVIASMVLLVHWRVAKYARKERVA